MRAPFFTTKAPGAGMGLGVFLASAIINRLDGDLQVESEIGQGTLVTVSIPANVEYEL